MRFWFTVLIVMVVGVAGFGQAATFLLNNDTSTHGFSLPLPCPSTNPGDCHNVGTLNNQALNGANSIWAECDFTQSSSFHNPECASSGGAQVVASGSLAAGTNWQYPHVVRATDATTQSNSVQWGGSTSGGGFDVLWDITSTRVMLMNVDPGGVGVPFSFDPNPSSPTYMNVARLYGRAVRVNHGTAAASKVTARLFYALVNSSAITGLVGTHGVSANEFVIVSYDFTSTTVTPTLANGAITFIFDFNAGCTGGSVFPPYNGTGVLWVSDDDQTFITDLNGPSGQDHYGWSVIYNRTLGCSSLDTTTGTVTHFNGTTGTIVNATSVTGIDWPIKYYIHEQEMFHDGGKLLIQGSGAGSGQGCVTGNNCDGDFGAIGGQNYIWETGVPYPGHPSPTGLNFYPQVSFQGGTATNGSTLGHSVTGYTLWPNMVQSNGYVNTWFLRPYSVTVPSTPTFLNPSQSVRFSCFSPTGATATCPNPDGHWSWANNNNAADNAPFFNITFEQQAISKTNHLIPDTPVYPLGDEIFIMPTTCYPSSCALNVPWRLIHTFASPERTHSGNFFAGVGTMAVSTTPVYNQYFIAFTSDWMGQLGCPSGGSGGYATAPWGVSCTGGPGGGYAHQRSDAFIVSVPIAPQ